MTNLELPRGETQTAITNYRAEEGKTFHVTYTYDCRAGLITTVLKEKGIIKASVQMEATADRIQTQGGFYQMWIGLEEKYNECPTYGWTYANLRVYKEPQPQVLRVHSENPLYFSNGLGKAIVLSGVNHGWELQDNGWSTPYMLDWEGFLDYLESYT